MSSFAFAAEFPAVHQAAVEAERQALPSPTSSQPVPTNSLMRKR
jgi:hypothetical protein